MSGNDSASAYTVRQVAEMTGFSPQTVTRIFENEQGIIVLEGGGPKRKYRSIRIPVSVYQRVIRKYQK